MSKPLTLLQQLVVLDERFISWLNGDHHTTNLEKPFITVFDTKDSEVTIQGHDTLKEALDWIEPIIGERSGWEFRALFDVNKSKEVRVAVKTTINVEK